ncbi:MAG TPA: Stp1/IreP family PP2C-type Ser/Thr phosphatase [Candidatus Bathyarchaeia archaeon]|nr:Stp1/IreP family PP2C-type Ser/Thr phosphatase [Candidatus Bathyarchaeia archaeon]
MHNFKFAAQTDKGNRREKNEDAYRINERFSFMAVADGVGGEPAGEVASNLAIEQIEGCVASQFSTTRPRAILEQAVKLANSVIYQRASEDRSLSGMSTTVVACLLAKERVFVAHVGDSRGYLITRAQITQITRDHSLVAEMVASGRISPEAARAHPYRHVITRALGLGSNVNVELGSFPWSRGAYVLLCTDGLTDAIEDHTIFAVISDTTRPLPSKCARLIELANSVGGFDNITAVLAERT